MNTTQERKPLPRINVLAIETQISSAPIFKRRTYYCLNLIFIMQVACWILTSMQNVSGISTHIPVVLISAVQIWVGVFLIYNAIAWLCAWMFNSKTKRQIIG